MTANPEALRFLDDLIVERRAKLEKAKAIADTIPGLTSDLAALERTRALAASNGAGPVLPPTDTADAEPLRQTEIVLDVLRAAARPIVLDEIMAGVVAVVPHAKRTTIMSHLSRFVESGRVRRTAPSTYEFVK